MSTQAEYDRLFKLASKEVALRKKVKKFPNRQDKDALYRAESDLRRYVESVLSEKESGQSRIF